MLSSAPLAPARPCCRPSPALSRRAAVAARAHHSVRASEDTVGHWVLQNAAAAFGVAGAAAPHALAEPLTTTDREHLARVAALLDGLKAALPAEGGAAAQAGGAAAAAADDDAPAKAAAFVETLVKTCWRMPTDSHDDILSAAQSEASFEPSAAPRAALAPKIDKLKAQLDAALGTHDKGAA